MYIVNESYGQRNAQANFQKKAKILRNFMERTENRKPYKFSCKVVIELILKQ